MITYKQFLKQDFYEDAKMGKQSDDQLKKIYKTASEKDQSSPANKSFTQRVAKEMKKRGISEQEGVRQVDFVDGITGEKETMNEILPALVGGAARAVGAGVRAAGSIAKTGAKVASKVAKPITKKVVKKTAKKVFKTAKKVVKKTGKVAGDVASSVPAPEVNVTVNKSDKKPQNGK